MRTFKQVRNDDIARNVMVKAHAATREIVQENPGLNYRTQFQIVLKDLNAMLKMQNEIQARLNLYLSEIEADGYQPSDASRTWKKGDKSRYYLTVRGYKNGKCKKEIKFGYVDNKTLSYVQEDRYTSYKDIYTYQY